MTEPQQGLSIYPLWLEKSICEANHVYIFLIQGVVLNSRPSLRVTNGLEKNRFKLKKLAIDFVLKLEIHFSMVLCWRESV